MIRLHLVSGEVRKAKADVVVTRVEPEENFGPGSARFADPAGMRSRYHVQAVGPTPDRYPYEALEQAYDNAFYLAAAVNAQFVAAPLLFPKLHRWNEDRLVRAVLGSVAEFPGDFELFLITRTLRQSEQVLRCVREHEVLGVS